MASQLTSGPRFGARSYPPVCPCGKGFGSPERESPGSIGSPPPVAPRIPKGLRIFPHFTKDLASGTAIPLTPLNPGFIDPVTNTLQRDGALQKALEALIRSGYRKSASMLSVALVDLVKPTKPRLAGWRESQPTYGASISKVLQLYALFQLKCDLEEIARIDKVSTEADLNSAAEKRWRSAGIKDSFPKVACLFDFVPGKSGLTVKLNTRSLRLMQTLSCGTDDCIDNNYYTTNTMRYLGLPYIGSVAWQSGLFDNVRGGLWLSMGYGKTVVESGPASCRLDSQNAGWPGRNPAAADSSTRKFVAGAHSATALSLATFYTLLAQNRLPSSMEIIDILKRGCWIGRDGCPSRSLEDAQIIAKCGYWGGYFHDAGLVLKTGTRYAFAIMDRSGEFCTYRLLADLDRLI
jgi:hypothetical protein